MKKEIYILIGPSAIGKTTFINNVGFLKEKMIIISRDEIDELFLYPPHNSELEVFQEKIFYYNSAFQPSRC